MFSHDLLLLTENQVERLLACRTAWEEGEDEERLERLRQREEDVETLREFAHLLTETDLQHKTNPLTHAQLRRLLVLARMLASNPNLDARLLRQPNEPTAFTRELKDLLFGPTEFPTRLRGFLSRRHTGGQTAMQLLCAAFPTEYPLVTRAGSLSLNVSPEQRREAIAAARQRYALPNAESLTDPHLALPDTDPVLRTLGDVLLYEEAHTVLKAEDYVQTHRLLTRGWGAQPRQSPRLQPVRYLPHTLPSPGPIAVREGMPPDYPPTAAPAQLPEPPDLSGQTGREILERIERFIAARGFTYPTLTLRNYYLCLQTKPFVFLAGRSGTGKTRLTSLFAEALTGAPDTHYRLIPVRPDWSNSAPLLGTHEGRYHSTPFLEFLRRAARPENAYRAFFLCLDEMNLARVEHYFAEALSAMEAPSRELLLPEGHAVRLPENLFLTGTLNSDATVMPLGQRVLDRANVLTLSEIRLGESPQETDSFTNNIEPRRFERAQALFLRNRVLTTGAARARLRQLGPSGTDYEAHVMGILTEANGQLNSPRLQFAYRVRDEVLRYCANSFDSDGSGLLTPETPHDAEANLQTALDLQLLQRVLPRLTGSQDQLEAPMRDLLRWAEKCGFPCTARRLVQLLELLQHEGSLRFDDFQSM